MACFELLRKQLDSAGLCIAPNKIQTTTPVQYLGTASLSNPRKSKLEGIKFLLYMIYINYWETLIGYI